MFRSNNKFAWRYSALFAGSLLAGVPTAKAMVSSSKSAEGMVSKAEFVPGEFIVKLKGNVQPQSLNIELLKLGMKMVRPVQLRHGLYLVRSQAQLAQKQNPSVAVAALNDLASVEYAEPNFIYRIAGWQSGDDSSVTPNDPSFSQLWGMQNNGQKDAQGTDGKVGADISAPKAWTLAKGSKDVVVAVIDTGVDYTHPDLQANIWSDPTDPKVHGYNAINDKLDPMDDHSHGTHCSGTIGGVGNNADGVVGVSWDVSIMGAKFLSASGGGTLEAAIKAIDWATEKGAHVMSNSWGGGGYSKALEESIARANEKGILFVAAAGNETNDNDANAAYPASYQIPNVIAVAASTNRDTFASFTNWGRRSVHLMAPGFNILSTVLDGKYDTYSGTSMATPHVSGAAALLLSKNPNLKPSEVIERLMRTSDKQKALRTKLISAGRLNAYNLVADITPPGFITIPDSAWKSLIPQQFASAHPYKENTKLSFEIKHPGAKFLRVKFKRFDLERGYDFLNLKDGKGEVVESLSGIVSANTWSSEVEGDTMKLEFVADDSVNSWGFELDGYTWTDFSGNTHFAKITQ